MNRERIVTALLRDALKSSRPREDGPPAFQRLFVAIECALEVLEAPRVKPPLFDAVVGSLSELPDISTVVDGVRIRVLSVDHTYVPGARAWLRAPPIDVGRYIESRNALLENVAESVRNDHRGHDEACATEMDAGGECACGRDDQCAALRALDEYLRALEQSRGPDDCLAGTETCGARLALAFGALDFSTVPCGNCHHLGEKHTEDSCREADDAGIDCWCPGYSAWVFVPPERC